MVTQREEKVNKKRSTNSDKIIQKDILRCTLDSSTEINYNMPYVFVAH